MLWVRAASNSWRRPFLQHQPTDKASDAAVVTAACCSIAAASVINVLVHFTAGTYGSVLEALSA